MSVQQQNNKFWYIYAMKYYTVMEKKELLPHLLIWMNLTNIYLSFSQIQNRYRNKSDTEEYILINSIQIKLKNFVKIHQAVHLGVLHFMLRFKKCWKCALNQNTKKKKVKETWTDWIGNQETVQTLVLPLRNLFQAILTCLGLNDYILKWR